jgi:hypothetical protein
MSKAMSVTDNKKAEKAKDTKGDRQSEGVLKRAFKRIAAELHENKTTVKVALSSALLLGTTALSSEFISSTIGACSILGGSLYLLAKAGDLAVDSAEALGEKMNISPLMIGLGAGATRFLSFW